MIKELENELKERLLKSCEECEKLGYNAGFFRGKINKDGAVETIKFLIDRPNPSSKFLEFSNDGRLIFSAEALICERPKFHKLFTHALLEKAGERLIEHEYELVIKNICPECPFEFKRKWIGIDAHWKSKHEKDTNIIYKEAFRLIKAGKYPPK